MNNPLDQEAASPPQQIISAIADAPVTAMSSNAIAVSDSQVTPSSLVGPASVEVDEAIRAIHGW